MSNRRISQTISTFNSQVNNINDRLQLVSADWGGVPRYQYLNLNPAWAAEIQTRANNWKTNIYPKYLDPFRRATVTGENGELRSFMNSFREYVSPVLEFIASSPLANHDDEDAFNLKLRRNRHKNTRRMERIQALCELYAEQKGRGAFFCHARKPDTEGRSHIPLKDGARQVEIAYNIISKQSDANLNIDAWRVRDRFSRTRFHLHVGAEFSAHWIQMSARWYHPSFPHFAGPWSEIITLVIP